MLPGLMQRSTSASSRLDVSSTVYVSALDGDGNEVAGIRHPELCVPLATHSGWNLLQSEGTQWTTVSSVTGNSFPFPSQMNPKAVTGELRLSISERYRDIDDFLSKLSTAADRLVAEGFLLAEDVDRVLAAGRAHYELFTEPRHNVGGQTLLGNIPTCESEAPGTAT
jgi:hypothetical protein